MTYYVLIIDIVEWHSPNDDQIDKGYLFGTEQFTKHPKVKSSTNEAKEQMLLDAEFRINWILTQFEIDCIYL